MHKYALRYMIMKKADESFNMRMSKKLYDQLLGHVKEFDYDSVSSFVRYAIKEKIKNDNLNND